MQKAVGHQGERRGVAFWEWLMKAHADLLAAENRVRRDGDGAAELAVRSAGKTLQAIAALSGTEAETASPWESIPAGWQARDLDLPLLRDGPRSGAAAALVVQEARRLWDSVFWDQEQHGTDMEVED